MRAAVLLISLAVALIAGCGRSDPDAVTEAIEAYSRAQAQKDAAAMCALIADAVLEETTGSSGAAGREQCRRGAVSQLTGRTGEDAALMRTARVEDVEIDGDRATATVALRAGGRQLTSEVRLVREGDDWRIAATDAPTAGEDAITYRVPSESMAPAFAAGQTVIGDGAAYETAEPQVGDVVVFNPPPIGAPCGGPVIDGSPCGRPVPELAEERYLKRIVALPGDRIAFRGGRAIRNGRRETLEVAPCDVEGCDLPRAVRVPRGHYFVAGDNRGNSEDSRHWGPIPRRAILARIDG